MIQLRLRKLPFDDNPPAAAQLVLGGWAILEVSTTKSIRKHGENYVFTTEWEPVEIVDEQRS